MYSVVTVVLNDWHGLKRTMASVESQTYKNSEWIIVDGGSTGPIKDFLADPPDSVTRCVSEPDEGIYDAMNIGVRLCQGQYVVFMNAGDRFANDRVLEDLHAHVEAAPSNPDVIFGGAILAFPSGMEKYRKPKTSKRYIWHGLPANHQATYYKRTVLAVTPYDLSYKICGDYYLAAKLYVSGARESIVNSPVVIFAVGGASYHDRSSLYREPFEIQRTVLKLPLYLRLVSLCKRFLATQVFKLLSGFNSQAG